MVQTAKTFVFGKAATAPGFMRSVPQRLKNCFRYGPLTPTYHWGRGPTPSMRPHDLQVASKGTPVSRSQQIPVFHGHPRSSSHYERGPNGPCVHVVPSD